jgi:hypothetical protein
MPENIEKKEQNHISEEIKKRRIAKVKLMSREVVSKDPDHFLNLSMDQLRTERARCLKAYLDMEGRDTDTDYKANLDLIAAQFKGIEWRISEIKRSIRKNQAFVEEYSKGEVNNGINYTDTRLEELLKMLNAAEHSFLEATGKGDVSEIDQAAKKAAQLERWIYIKSMDVLDNPEARESVKDTLEELVPTFNIEDELSHYDGTLSYAERGLRVSVNNFLHAELYQSSGDMRFYARDYAVNKAAAEILRKKRDEFLAAEKEEYRKSGELLSKEDRSRFDSYGLELAKRLTSFQGDLAHLITTHGLIDDAYAKVMAKEILAIEAYLEEQKKTKGFAGKIVRGLSGLKNLFNKEKSAGLENADVKVLLEEELPNQVADQLPEKERSLVKENWPKFVSFLKRRVLSDRPIVDVLSGMTAGYLVRMGVFAILGKGVLIASAAGAGAGFARAAVTENMGKLRFMGVRRRLGGSKETISEMLEQVEQGKENRELVIQALLAREEDLDEFMQVVEAGGESQLLEDWANSADAKAFGLDPKLEKERLLLAAADMKDFYVSSVKKLLEHYEVIENQTDTGKKLLKLFELRDPLVVDAESEQEQEAILKKRLDEIIAIQKDVERATGRRVNWGNIAKATMVGAVAGVAGYGWGQIFQLAKGDLSFELPWKGETGSAVGAPAGVAPDSVGRVIPGNTNITDTLGRRIPGLAAVGDSARADSIYTEGPGNAGVTVEDSIGRHVPGGAGVAQDSLGVNVPGGAEVSPDSVGAKVPGGAAVTDSVGNRVPGGAGVSGDSVGTRVPGGAAVTDSVGTRVPGGAEVGGVAGVESEIPKETYIVREGEGFSHVIRDQYRAWISHHPERLPEGVKEGTPEFRRFVNQQVQDILEKNKIIRPDGSEIRIRTVGSEVIWDPNTGNVSMPAPKDLYGWTPEEGNISYSELNGSVEEAPQQATAGITTAETTPVSTPPVVEEVQGVPVQEVSGMRMSAMSPAEEFVFRGRSIRELQDSIQIGTNTPSTDFYNVFMGTEIPADSVADIAVALDYGEMTIDEVSRNLIQLGSEDRTDFIFSALDDIRASDNGAIFNRGEAMEVSRFVDDQNFQGATDQLFSYYKAALESGNLKDSERAQRIIFKFVDAISNSNKSPAELYEEYLQRQAVAVAQ